jgi:hypothetical protein
MAENRNDLGKGSEQRIDHDALPEMADSNIKRQSGRPPTRPPYEQYLRVSKVLK